MKNRIQDGLESGRIDAGSPARDEELVARFGEAILLRSGGRIVLRGGSMADRMEALEWMVLFMPESAASLKE